MPTFFGGSLLSLAFLVVGVTNPIHSILILIFVFLFGSYLFFLIPLEYISILFMIVYVGAIVVLFLFIVMRLELKAIHHAERLSNLFPYRRRVLFILLFALCLFRSEAFPFYSTEKNAFYPGVIIYADAYYATLPGPHSLWQDFRLNIEFFLETLDALKTLGHYLYTYADSEIILASVILLLSMLGAISVTMERSGVIRLKSQDAIAQGMRSAYRPVVSVILFQLCFKINL